MSVPDQFALNIALYVMNILLLIYATEIQHQMKFL